MLLGAVISTSGAAQSVATRLVNAGAATTSAKVVPGGPVSMDVRLDIVAAAVLGTGFRITQLTPPGSGFISITGRSFIGSPFTDTTSGTPDIAVLAAASALLDPANDDNLGRTTIGLVGIPPASNVLAVNLTLTASGATPLGTYTIGPTAGASFATDTSLNDYAMSGGTPFTIIVGQTLSVTRSGAGTGTVTADSGLINCGATCSDIYPGTVVTLTATPIGGSSFTGWSGGGCSGTGTCVVTVTTATTVLATFTADTTNTTVDLNQHGLTGSWYEPATSGQGFAVEVFPDQLPGQGQAFVSWFTYDTVSGGAERQRWYTLQGPVATGQPNASLTIYQNTGGNFNAPPATNAQAVGMATLSLDTCSSGQLSYAFTDGTGRADTIPLTRLLPNVTCSATTPHPTSADFALSGSWYAGAATSGQGIAAEVAPNAGALFLSWFTYMPNGASAGAAGQRWYTAQGAFTPGLRTIPVQIYETTGGIFDASTPPGQNTVSVGTGTMAFQSCSAATFGYNFTGGSSVGQSGTITLGRVGPVPPGCTM